MSVTAPLGFRAAGVHAGLKSGPAPDLALVVNDGPGVAAAGVVTGNRVKAAPVRWTEQVLAGGRLTAVLLNSGGANACTGPAGFQDTHASAETVAAQLGCGAADVAVCSTGLIGDRLPMDRVRTGIAAAAAALTSSGGPAAAEAIMTTDTVPKTVSVRGAGFTVGGMAKGAGMLAPGLATMLAVLTTDAEVPAPALDAALRAATAVTFDRVDGDGCMSTNDTVLLLASAACGVQPTQAQLDAAVLAACQGLAMALVADVEGATKQVQVLVQDAASAHDAVTVARAVARSNLVKCALAGEDPNWGRVLAAVGTTPAAFDPDDLAVAINGVWVCRGGSAADDRTLVNLTGPRVLIQVSLGAGQAAESVWTSDLTAAYVHENSAYST